MGTQLDLVRKDQGMDVMMENVTMQDDMVEYAVRDNKERKMMDDKMVH